MIDIARATAQSNEWGISLAEVMELRAHVYGNVDAFGNYSEDDSLEEDWRGRVAQVLIENQLPEVIKSSIDFLKTMQTNRSEETSDFVRSMFRKPQSEEYLQKLIKASMATPTDAAIAMRVGGFNTDNRPALSKIDKPTLIVEATKRLLPQFQDMQKSIPHARLEFFDDAGHALFVDDSEKFNALLDEFLTSLKK